MSLREIHPYGEFIPKGAKAMIVGTFPASKFTGPQKLLSAGDIDFSYGDKRNQLWKLMGNAFRCDVDSVEMVKAMLTKRGIAVGDVVLSCVRSPQGGSEDKCLFEFEWNKGLLAKIQSNHISKLLFTSKIAQEWFSKYIFPGNSFTETILPSPSPTALRAYPSNPEYVAWLAENPGKRPSDFRVVRYAEVFSDAAFPRISG